MHEGCARGCRCSFEPPLPLRKRPDGASEGERRLAGWGATSRPEGNGTHQVKVSVSEVSCGQRNANVALALVFRLRHFFTGFPFSTPYRVSPLTGHTVTHCTGGSLVRVGRGLRYPQCQILARFQGPPLDSLGPAALYPLPVTFREPFGGRRTHSNTGSSLQPGQISTGGARREPPCRRAELPWRRAAGREGGARQGARRRPPPPPRRRGRSGPLGSPRLAFSRSMRESCSNK